MTCIVGMTDGLTIIMAGDRQAAVGSQKSYLASPKIWKKGGWIFGSAWSQRVANVLQECWEVPTDHCERPYTQLGDADEVRGFLISTVIPSIREILIKARLLDGDGKADLELLIGTRGRLFFVGSKFAVIEIEHYEAIGSGAPVALGSLYAQNIPGPDVAVRAVEAASRHAKGVGGEIDVLMLKYGSVESV